MSSYQIPEFHNNTIKWSSTEFKDILSQYGFDPERDREKVIIHNNLYYAASEDCYWDAEYYWTYMRGDTCTMGLKG